MSSVASVCILQSLRRGKVLSLLPPPQENILSISLVSYPQIAYFVETFEYNRRISLLPRPFLASLMLALVFLCQILDFLVLLAKSLVYVRIIQLFQHVRQLYGVEVQGLL